MTVQKSFKHRVRARMAKTGESYTAARRMLIAAGDRPDTQTTDDFKPPFSEASLTKATGHGWQHWFALLDAWGGTGHSHGEIAAWLQAEQGVSGWWAQSITVGYERARGMRAVGQNAEGWSIGASKTVAVPVETLFRAFEDESLRERWLPGAEMRLRTATAPRLARYDWEDGSTRLVVGLDALGESKSRVSIQHERLPDAETAEEMKAWWRRRVTALKDLLEAPPN